MSPRSLLIFFAGFATGLVFLGGLWTWRMPGPPRAMEESAVLKEVSPRALPRSARGLRQSVPAAPTDLQIPVAGVTPNALRDDFEEMHNGHRHEAIDIPAPRGTHVLAVAAGTIAKLFLSKPGGLTIYQFDDSQTWCYYYAHLDGYASDLKEGARVARGTVLGYVGTTGNAPPDTPHLHFAVFRLGPERHWWQGDAVNPYPRLAGVPLGR